MARAARRSGKKNKKLWLVLVVVILIIAIALGVLYFVRPDVLQTVLSLIFPPETPQKPDNTTVTGDILSVQILDIGQGDCIYIEFPDGQNMIMDIGSEFATTSPWDVIDGALQEDEVENIDYLFITHGDYDHIRDAKKLLDNYEVENIYMPLEKAHGLPTWLNLLEAAREETYTDESGAVRTAAYHENVGVFAISGENWVMNCYTYDLEDYPEGNDDPERINSVSPICLLEYAGRTIVLTGDSNEMNEEYLLGKGYFGEVDADVLKVAHHGSYSSTTEAFLDAIDAEFAVISTSGTEEDPHEGYIHPNPGLMQRLRDYSDVTPDGDHDGFREIYITAEVGTVTVLVGENGGLNILTESGEKEYVGDGADSDTETDEGGTDGVADGTADTSGAALSARRKDI